MAETEGVRLTQAHIPRADCPSHRVHRDRRAMREGRSATFRRVDQGSPALLLKTRFRRQRIQRPNPRKRRSARALGNMRASRGASSTDQRMRTISCSCRRVAPPGVDMRAPILRIRAASSWTQANITPTRKTPG